jgi:glycosyltransferase involved in cell wall biosynthesis
VEFVGPRFGAEKEMEFRSADIFVLPSDYDTFGLVLLEAMQYGVPCISTMMGGIPDVLGEGRGMLMESITATALEACLEKLITQPEERMRISADAFKYFSSNFSVSIFEQRLRNILAGQPDRVCDAGGSNQ